MKTTIELPDDLYRKAKAVAALRGKPVRDLVEEGLRRVLEPELNLAKGTLAERMEKARGIVNSGVPDLATNPAYLDDLGRDGRGDC